MSRGKKRPIKKQIKAGIALVNSRLKMMIRGFK